MVSQQIHQALAAAAASLGLNSPINLAHPENPAHGDYASNLALVSFKQLAKQRPELKSPLDLAQLLAVKLSGIEGVAKVSAAAPGFVNFHLDNRLLWQAANQAVREKERFGQALPQTGKTVMVEFSQANTHKLFHIGHLRGTISGEAIARLLGAAGYKVIRANYQGDLGPHVAKALWGWRQLGYSPEQPPSKRMALLGQAYAKGSQAYEDNPQARAAIQKLNRQIYRQDPSVNKLWQQTRQWSLDYFAKIYRRLGVNFDRLYFESEVWQRGREIVKANIGKIFQKSRGAVIFPGEKYGLHTRVFLTKDGWPTYEAKDLGLAELQLKEHQPERIVHVVSSEQREYFQVLFQVLKLIMPSSRGREYHRVYGWVRLKNGKMSSRRGQVVLGEWLLDETKKRLRAKFKMGSAKAEKVALAAVKYSILRLDPLTELVFDFDQAISLNGDSGPYLQYAAARTGAILRRSGKKIVAVAKPKPSPEEEEQLLHLIYRYPEVVVTAAQEYSPNRLANYLYRLARQFSLFYDRQRVLGSPAEAQRLMLVAAAGQIIKNGLGLLGIEAVEKM